MLMVSLAILVSVAAASLIGIVIISLHRRKLYKEAVRKHLEALRNRGQP